MHNITFYGLHKLYYHLMEKLGWMFMAKHHNNQLKIDAYMFSIKDLIQCLDAKLSSTKDHDRKDDLIVLIENTEYLHEVATQVLSEKLDVPEKCEGSNSHEVTMHGLEKWMKYKFEKLGWMLLAKRDGNDIKTIAYLDSIDRLKASLKTKLGQVEEKDRAKDIQIVWNKVCVLDAAAKKLLSSSATHSVKHSSMMKSSKHSKRTKKAIK